MVVVVGAEYRPNFIAPSCQLNHYSAYQICVLGTAVYSEIIEPCGTPFLRKHHLNLDLSIVLVTVKCEL